MSILIKSGRLIDPANGIDDTLDLLIQEGRIAQVGKNLDGKGAEVIDAAGLLVTPGLIDMHVHLRDPGQEYKEDIVSGTKAAVAGGFTSVACMPNTNPINDNKAVTRYIVEKAKVEGAANVFPIGSITKGLKGETLSEMGDLKDAGCVALSDDGKPVSDGEIMRRALEYAKPFNLPLISHAEDLSLVGEGVMNYGFVATELGLKGIPWVAEDAATARDVLLAEFTGAHLHVAHVSTKGSVEIIRAAKKRGVKVTCEATPHHFTLTEEAVRGYDTNAKMNPPLRTAEDVAALRQGLADGTVDIIATDHAPHPRADKDCEWAAAAFGMTGLETALAVVITQMVAPGRMTWADVARVMSAAPARIGRIDTGPHAQGRPLTVGEPANVTLVDPTATWRVDPAATASGSRNTPFAGRELTGRVRATFLRGRPTVLDGAAVTR